MAVIRGDGRANTLAGTGLADTIYGFGGNDRLWGRGGDDLLEGGFGDDALRGGAGFDEASWYNDGGARGVRVDVGAGRAVRGGEVDRFQGIEKLTGTNHADAMFGGRAADQLSGAGGGDDLYGAGGDDTLTGGLGEDRLDGGAGFDMISYRASTSLGVTVFLDWDEYAARGGEVDRLNSIEGAIGTRFRDSLFGDSSANRFVGLAGDDGMQCYAGSDRAEGGAGDDYLNPGSGDDVMIGGAGADRFDLHTDYFELDDDAGTDLIADFERGTDKFLYYHRTEDALLQADDLFGHLDSNRNGRLDGADAFVTVERVGFEGRFERSTVIDYNSVALDQASGDTLTFHGVTGLTIDDFRNVFEF